MLEKMQLIYLMGRLDDIDRIIRKYITKYDIQLEYALKEIADTYAKESCLSENPYTAYVAKAEKFMKGALSHSRPWTELLEEEAIKIIDEADEFFERRRERVKHLEAKQAVLSKAINRLEPFKHMDVDMSFVKNLRFIAFSFGRMPAVNFKQFEIYIHDKEDIIFLESKRDSSYVYGIYFVPLFKRDKIDTLMTSLNFERVSIPCEYEAEAFSSTPLKAYTMMVSELEETRREISAQHNETIYTYGINAGEITNAYNSLKKLQNYYDIRKYAAKTHNGYYIFTGWAAESEAARLERDTEYDEKVIFTNENSDAAKSTLPPTSLKNNFFTSPFEFFVKAYGLPKYGEIDPTPFVAVTYFLLFGMMFGDLGQGAVLSLAGYLIYRFKGLSLGKILGFVGISSMFFGVMYGSVFGLEHIIPTLWLKPAESVNSILIITIVCGMVLILISMLLNIVNAVKQKDKVRLFFGPSGVAGVVFYTGVIISLRDFVYGSGRLGSILLIPFVAVPLILIAFRHQIAARLDRRKVTAEGGPALFMLEILIETFEILLTYFTNTVSFVRIGAFALSHAGMMAVVLLLAQRGDGYNLTVMIIGNLIVILMEGLVVGIQALRIQFYELFSRYYEGDGREFVPIKAELSKS